MEKRIRIALVVLVSLVCVSTGLAAGQKKIVLTPNDLQWKEGPAAIPGSKAAVLEGDPAKAEFFVSRLKVAAGTSVHPHVHDKIERVTVISGKMNLAMGTKREAATVLPAGSYISLPPNTVHNAWFDEETVLQISTMGPWSFRPVKRGGAGK